MRAIGHQTERPATFRPKPSRLFGPSDTTTCPLLYPMACPVHSRRFSAHARKGACFGSQPFSVCDAGGFCTEVSLRIQDASTIGNESEIPKLVTLPRGGIHSSRIPCLAKSLGRALLVYAADMGACFEGPLGRQGVVRITRSSTSSDQLHTPSGPRGSSSLSPFLPGRFQAIGLFGNAVSPRVTALFPSYGVRLLWRHADLKMADFRLLWAATLLHSCSDLHSELGRGGSVSDSYGGDHYASCGICYS